MIAFPTLIPPGAAGSALDAVANHNGAKARDKNNERSRMAYLSKLCP
jgi:hypothetical protein